MRQCIRLSPAVVPAFAVRGGRLARLARGLALALAFGLSAHAASLTWDNNAATAPNPQDGTGNWDTTTANWWTGAANTTWSNATPDSASFGVGGTGGTVTLAAAGITANNITFNAFTGTYTLQTGPLTLNGGMTINAGAGAVTITSLISGAGGVTINSGTVALGGTSSSRFYDWFTGGVTLNGGTLRLPNNGYGSGETIPWPAYGNAVATGPIGSGTLTLAGGTVTADAATARWIANPVTLNGSTTFGAAATYTGALTFCNQVTLGTDVTPTFSVATLFGGLAWSADRSFTYNATANALTIRGWLSGGTNTLTLQGTGTNLVFGDATSPVLGTGNLQIGTASSAFTLKNPLNTTAIKGNLNLPNFAGNTLDLNTFNFTIGSLSGGGAAGGVIGSASGTPTLVIAGASGNATFDGVISGATGVKLIKTGGSTQTLTRNPTFTGATTVYAGTLALSGAATLTNSVGTYLAAGGTLRLDNSGGTMVNRLTDTSAITLGSLTLTGFNGDGAKTETVGALTLTSPGTITVNNGSPTDQTTLAFTGAGTRNAGSAVNFVGTNGTLGGGANSPNVTNSVAWAGAANGILPWGTVGGTSWAESNANSIRAYSGTFVDPTSAASDSTRNAQLSGSGTIGSAKAFNSVNVIATAGSQSTTLSGNLNLTSGAILKTGTDAYAIGGASTVGAGATGTGTELIAHVFGGDLTISAPLNTAIVNIAQGGSGRLILSGARAASLTTIGIAGTLELDGASTAITGAISGPGALVANLNSGQTLTLSATTSTFVGGVTLGANTSLTIGNSSTLVGGAVTQGPLGLGPLTIGGGANASTSILAANRTIHNDLVINGDFAFSAITGGGNLTVDPQSRGGFGSIQINGARTIAILGNTLQLNGPITGGGTPSLALKGAGTLFLNNTTPTASTFGDLTIGDTASQPTGAQGTSVLVYNQNALGTGAVTINYGGSLNINMGASPTNSANNFTVNAGGFMQYRDGNLDTSITPTGLTTLRSLSGIGWYAGGLSTFSYYNYTVGSTLAVPTAGAVSFYGKGPGNYPAVINVTGAYPSLTGTMVLGGHSIPGETSNANKVIFSGVTTLSSVDGVARTFGFNDQGGSNGRNGLMLLLGGVALNADLTVKGSGNGSVVAGNYPVGLGSELGSLTSSGATGNHALTVAMSPVGVATVAGPAPLAGNPGVNAVTVTSGYLGIDAGNVTSNGKVFASAANISLNGGGIAVGGGVQQTSPNVTIQDNIAVGANGGTILATSSNMGNTYLTLSGQITGSAPLTLIAGRQGNVGQNQGSTLSLSGNNAGYSGNITLARTGGWGGFLFHGGALGTNNPIGTGTVTAPNGTGFGFNNLVSAVALMPKFVSGTETVLDAVNLTGATINLSNTGTNALNFSGRLGNSLAAPGNLSFNSTVITPYDATGYRFAGAYSSYTITFGTANILKDGVGPAIAYPVDLSRVANAPGQVAAVASSLYSITAAQNFSGAFTMDGGGPAATTYNATMCLYDNNHFTPGNMAATIGAGGDFANTSSVNLKFTDQLVLSGLTGKISSTAGGAGLPVTVQGGSILTIGDSTATNNDGVGGINRLGGATAKLTLGGTYGGGILQVAYGSAAGNPSQTLGSLTIGTGQSAISTLNTAAGTLGLTVSSGAVTRSGGFGTTLYLPFPTTQFTGVTLTGAGSTGGLAVNGWTYVPGNAGAVTSANFAAVNGSSQLVAISPTVNNINTAGADFVNSASGTYTLTANNTVNTMTLNTATAVALGTNILTVAKGGIIANLTGAAISGTSPGGLTSGYNHELIVNSVPTGTLTISAPILQDSGSNNIDLTKLGGSSTVANSLILSSGSNNLGNVWISGGSVRVQTGVGSLGVGSTSGNTITLEGGALYIDLTGSQTFNQALVAMPRGAYSYNQGTAQLNAIQQVTAGQVTTFTGPVTLNGIMQVPAVAGTTVTLNGTVSGPGALLNGTANSMSRSTLVLGGSNAGFSGGVAVYQGAHLRLENAATPAGTGALVGLTTTSYAAQNAALYFGTGAAGISLANDVVNLQTLANWNTGSSQTAAGTVETFAGNVATTTGLTFQGNATSTSAISETVLAGKVSVNGIPQAYNWSTTPTTSMQNFLNGQGGINLGVTRYSGFTLLNNNTASASALAIDAPGVSGTIFGNGALGFVRFGGANSFLPGSVGPGYLAALAKAGAGSNGMFGYLLSGGAANGGSTYTLPEGKGFVIGSLGSGTQVAGVLGATGGTATLLGGPKAATGQTLTGFYGGDVNIHANGATDTQTLNLLARAAGDTLVLGDATHPVVFTPTYGDSGTTSAITFMAKRTGGTTLAALGAGTVDVTSTQYTNTDGTDARPGITWNVSAGTLRYTQNDGAAAKYAGTIVQGTGRLDVNGTLASDVTVLTGAVLGGTGAITAGLPADLVTVQSGGNIAPGSSPGIFTLANSTPGWNALNLQASSIYQWDLIAETTAGAGTNFDQIAITAGNLTVDPLAQLLPSFSGSTTGPVIDTFWNLPHRWANIINVTGGGTVTGTSLLIDNSAWVTLGSFTTAPAQTGSGIDLLWSSFVPEPTALVLLAAAATLGFARRRR